LDESKREDRRKEFEAREKAYFTEYEVSSRKKLNEVSKKLEEEREELKKMKKDNEKLREQNLKTRKELQKNRASKK
jgi:predicted S18 family serine protease